MSFVKWEVCPTSVLGVFGSLALEVLRHLWYWVYMGDEDESSLIVNYLASCVLFNWPHCVFKESSNFLCNWRNVSPSTSKCQSRIIRLCQIPVHSALLWLLELQTNERMTKVILFFWCLFLVKPRPVRLECIVRKPDDFYWCRWRETENTHLPTVHTFQFRKKRQETILIITGKLYYRFSKLATKLGDYLFICENVHINLLA